MIDQLLGHICHKGILHQKCMRWLSSYFFLAVHMQYPTKSTYGSVGVYFMAFISSIRNIAYGLHNVQCALVISQYFVSKELKEDDPSVVRKGVNK